MHKIKMWFMTFVVTAGLGGVVASLAVALPSFAADQPDPGCNNYILTIPPWYKDMARRDSGGGCSILSPDSFKNGIQGFIWKIVLNIIEILLNLTAYITVGFIIYGGFKYMLATGSPDGIAKAKTTIMNAVIGLVLSIASIAIVNLIAGAIK